MVATTFHFHLVQVTWLLEENLCFCLFWNFALKDVNVKGVNVRFIKNTSIFNWLEKHAKYFQYFLSCNKSTHHSLLYFCIISVNYGFFLCFWTFPDQAWKAEGLMWIWQAEISGKSYYIVFFRVISVASYSVYFLLELVWEVCLLYLPHSS